MPSYRYERLSGQDNDFLLWESPNLPMHVAGLQILDAGPLRNDHGGIDFEAIKRLTESVLHLIPRYRQKLAWIPDSEQAVWVDDEHFNLDYHFRHTSLPRPGTDAQLKALIARLMEHLLDRSRPLWETWVVEGLEGDRFAMVNKIHHCMIDGASGVQLSQLLMSSTPQSEPRPAPRFIPRPAPAAAELINDERIRRLTRPLMAAQKLLDFARESRDPGGEILRQARLIAGLGDLKSRSASETPLNGPIGPHRIVEWATMPLEQVKAVRRALSCTVNDVVLTTVTGAVRELMRHRQVDPGSLDFRVSTPVNLRKERASGEMGNHVSSWIVPLPLGLEDPLDQLKEIHAITTELKESDQAGAVHLVTNMLEWLPFSTQSLSVGTMNTIVTNVPGPPFPLYMLGARVREMIPFGPLIENVGLTIGVLSYNGQILWGFNADSDRVPDLADFRRGIHDAFERLAEAAEVDLAAAPKLVSSGSPAPSEPDAALVSDSSPESNTVRKPRAEPVRKKRGPEAPRAN